MYQVQSDLSDKKSVKERFSYERIPKIIKVAFCSFYSLYPYFRKYLYLDDRDENTVKQLERFQNKSIFVDLQISLPYQLKSIMDIFVSLSTVTS